MPKMGVPRPAYVTIVINKQSTEKKKKHFLEIRFCIICLFYKIVSYFWTFIQIFVFEHFYIILRKPQIANVIFPYLQ